MPQLLISDEIYRAGLSNIGGCDETFFQAIIMGSWPAQELRRLWSAQDGKQIDWKYFDQLASSGPPLARVIDIDNEIFRSPGNMELAIREFCRRTGQQPPNHRAEMACAVYEALALKVAMACGEMQQLAEYDADEIIVLGGGSQNEIVNQWISDASGLPVRTGSANATALGNAIVQAHTLGWISSLTEGPQSIRGEYQERVFEPHAERDWEGAKRGIRIWQHQ